MKIKKGDLVQVITGKDKGKQGKADRKTGKVKRRRAKREAGNR